jgi:hypothetical protein
MSGVILREISAEGESESGNRSGVSSADGRRQQGGKVNDFKADEY